MGRRRPIEELVGDRVRQLRQERALSQGELARRAKVSVSIVHAIEHASRSTTIKTLGRIAEALDVRPADLLEGEGGPRPPSGSERAWRTLAADLRERDLDGLRAIQRLVRTFDEEVGRAASRRR